MSYSPDPILKIDRIREAFLITSIDYLLSREMGIKRHMPHSVKDTLENYQNDYRLESEKRREEGKLLWE